MSSSEKLKQIAQEAIDHLDLLNQQYPGLASDNSKEAVEKWRRKPVSVEAVEVKTGIGSGSTELSSDDVSNTNDSETQLKEVATELLKEHEIEDVIDILASDHDTAMNAHQLVELVGQSAYVTALKREAEVFESNSITYDQAASLWNSLGRPALGDEQWSGRTVSILCD